MIGRVYTQCGKHSAVHSETQFMTVHQKHLCVCSNMQDSIKKRKPSYFLSFMGSEYIK